MLNSGYRNCGRQRNMTHVQILASRFDACIYTAHVRFPCGSCYRNYCRFDQYNNVIISDLLPGSFQLALKPYQFEEKGAFSLFNNYMQEHPNHTYWYCALTEHDRAAAGGPKALSMAACTHSRRLYIVAHFYYIN